MADEIESWEDVIECPYCGHKERPSGDHESDNGEWECGNEDCMKVFHVTVEYDPNYSVSKI